MSDAKVIMDRDTGRSRGFAFISFAESRDAEDAMRGLNGEVRTKGIDRTSFVVS